jgi:hypothetical protein
MYVKPQKQREKQVRKFLIASWEFVSSPTGISVVTFSLFAYSYWKYRRYGTDAGD